jgi:hypothetical protein
MSSQEVGRSMDYADSPQRESERRLPKLDTFRTFLVYWATGALSGAVTGILIRPAASVHDTVLRAIHFGEWAWELTRIGGRRAASPLEILWNGLAEATIGAILGFFSVHIFLLMSDIWPKTKHPAFVTVFCAASVGTFHLIALVESLLVTRAQSFLVERLVAIGTSMILAGTFGFVHASLARFLITRWEQRRHAST